MKIYFLINFCIAFLFNICCFSENLSDLKEIFCNHYQNVYLGSEERQKFEILNLFKKIDKKAITIDISENMDIELKDEKETKEIEVPWEFEITNFTSLKHIPLDPDEQKNLFDMDKGSLKRREKVKDKSNYFKNGYKIIYIKENNFNKCHIAGTFTSKIFLNFKIEFNILAKELFISDGDHLKGSQICFKIIGIKERGIIGYSVLEREIVIYGIIE